MATKKLIFFILLDLGKLKSHFLHQVLDIGRIKANVIPFLSNVIDHGPQAKFTQNIL